MTNVHNDQYQNQIAISINCQVRMQIKYMKTEVRHSDSHNLSQEIHARVF